MKLVLPAVVAVVVSAATAFFINSTLQTRHRAQLAMERAAWEEEKASLQLAIQELKSRPPEIRSAPAAPAPVVAAAPKVSPAHYVARLRALAVTAGPIHPRAARQAVHDLEELLACGTNALPAIREFLGRYEDADLAVAGQGRWKVTEEFVVPPSLRLGLLDVVKRIGGADAEQVLADTLTATSRGVEVAWLARALQEMAPNKYRDSAVAVARDLLGRTPPSSPSALDQNHREHLFGVLALYGDTSYVSTAQAQLIQADGGLDRWALKYLQQTLGSQAVAVAAQTWQDPRLTDPAKKEPLARLALNFVGADAQANQFYQQAINDLSLPKNHRKNLIEDLNQDGFPDLRNLGARDLPLIQNRLALIEQLATGAQDPINSAAFAEAYKDLLNMRERALGNPIKQR